MKRIYCDISATTPLDRRVSSFMYDLQSETFGNPSSMHREGQSARAVIEKSRCQLAQVLKSKPDEIIFTSSGTESNNMALQGVLKTGEHFITSNYEHPSILKVLPFLKEKGVDCSLVKPDKNGIIQPESIEQKIKKNTRLISIMYVNNELGTINPIKKIAELSKERGILIHSDAVQALGKIPVDTDDIPVDFLSMSSHKLYGPKGVGALYKREGSSIEPLIYGGGQESNLRGSTENIAGIGGFGMAAEIATMEIEENSEHIMRLETHFINQLNEKEIPYQINGSQRVPGVFNITFPALDGKNLVLQLDLAGIGISYGAACASGTMKTSSMLIDLGLTEEEALSTVRISFGKIHTLENIQIVTNTIGSIFNQNLGKEMAHAG